MNAQWKLISQNNTPETGDFKVDIYETKLYVLSEIIESNMIISVCLFFVKFKILKKLITIKAAGKLVPLSQISFVIWYFLQLGQTIQKYSVKLGQNMKKTNISFIPVWFLTHWGRDKMDAISQTTFSSAFYWMKMYELWLKIHWSLFLRVQLTIFQHWFR